MIKTRCNCTSQSFVIMDPRWKHPFTAIIVRPTGCGKTVFTFKFISEASDLIVPSSQNIIYCYRDYRPIFNEYPHIKFNEGLPNIEQFDGKERTLLILDDLMEETNDSVSNIFTKVSHHRNVFFIYLSQNLFYKSKRYNLSKVAQSAPQSFVRDVKFCGLAEIDENLFGRKIKYHKISKAVRNKNMEFLFDREQTEVVSSGNPKQGHSTKID